ncbi:PD-(D/E)XK nuclease family protein [Pantanalinema rosaneae CENA516]|uniref:PD-(D/E)XK nuclease family protein n=1 Tax=Pantanalinema rosaneae TaxID=1620701 RepID=UPI003D6EEAE2
MQSADLNQAAIVTTQAMTQTVVSLPVSSFPMRLSQTQLSLLTTCPRKFQHIYLEQLAAPTDLAQQERQQQGSQFHLLLQQWQLGLPVEPMLQADDRLRQWFHSFTQAAPEILALLPEGSEVWQQTEHDRTLEFQGYLLSVRYDLLLSNPWTARILDWKTYPRPRQPEQLWQSWQTRLYLFVLAETSPYSPDQLSMIYWFFQTPTLGDQSAPPPQSYQLNYSCDRHEQTRKDLIRLLDQLTDWLAHYHQGEAFPQINTGIDQCQMCNFVVRCDRQAIEQSNPISESSNRVNTFSSFELPNLEDIQEIPLELI